MAILVIYCSVKNYPKLRGVKQLLIMLIDTVDQEFRSGTARMLGLFSMMYEPQLGDSKVAGSGLGTFPLMSDGWCWLLAATFAGTLHVGSQGSCGFPTVW